MPIGPFQMPFKLPFRVPKLTRWNSLAFLLQLVQIQCRLFPGQHQTQHLLSFLHQHNHRIFLRLPTPFHLTSIHPPRTSFKPELYPITNISLHLIICLNIMILDFCMETLTYIRSQFQYQHRDQEPLRVHILCPLQ